MKTDLASLSQQLRDGGWNPCLTENSYLRILASGLRSKNLPLAAVAVELAFDEQPLTLRGLMYRLVSAGWLPSTGKEHYARVGRILTTLREAGIVPFNWIVDNVRETNKPSSWSGLNEFTDTVRNAYRLDFWSTLPTYTHLLCEKDAIAGTLAPVTREYDVALSPIRGYVSLSFAHEIAETWNEIQKPIHAYYVGDFDASGFDLERDLKSKLERYCNSPFTWERLAVNAEDFAAYDLIRLEPKKLDTRYAEFVRVHGQDCAEVDAIPATELRNRVEQAIRQHIPEDEWTRLQEVERLEKESWNHVLNAMQPSQVA